MIQDTINRLVRERTGAGAVRHDIEKVGEAALGDYASNLPFMLARATGGDPRAIALGLADALRGCPEFDEVKVGGKGFLNFVLSWDFIRGGLMTALAGPPAPADREKILVEYVSANPTGPLNVVNGRAAALGNALVNLLRHIGCDARSENYINDSGNQVALLRASLAARVRELSGERAEIPPGGYPGEYLVPIAREVIERKIEESAWSAYVLGRIVEHQTASLGRLGFGFDSVTYESSIRPDNPAVLERLRSAGVSFVEDGAVWFRSTSFGDRADRVLVKSDGSPTYFLTDLSYHLKKFERGFDRLITIWGPDHHGDIPRLKGGVRALGGDADRLEILICQETHLKRGKETVSMSKRAGDFVTLDEIAAEVGPDALKFFLLMRKPSQHLEFDIELAKKLSSENPVYYVQYGHARIAGILKYAADNGFAPDPSSLGLLDKSEERELAKAILDFPDVVLTAALKREPHRLTYYLIDLATTFHYFYERHRIVSSDAGLNRARLQLCALTRDVLGRALTLLAIGAPERM